jgi:hypothetical protein
MNRTTEFDESLPPIILCCNVAGGDHRVVYVTFMIEPDEDHYWHVEELDFETGKFEFYNIIKEH